MECGTIDTKCSCDGLNIFDSALKLFLRELPDPLISKTLRDDIQNALDKKPSEAGASLRGCVEERKKKGSPEEKLGLDVLAFIMRHLSYVSTFHKKNRVRTVDKRCTLCLSIRLEGLRLPRTRLQTRPDARARNLSKDPPRHKVHVLVHSKYGLLTLQHGTIIN